jgi:AcrR family transcriptional regulator
MPPGAQRDDPQPARRAQTIVRLLDATVDSLVEDGYAATTIRAVARRAGVSQGAATHHFAKRLDLVAAAIERLSEQRLAELRAAAAALPDEAEARRKATLDLLCATAAGPLFVAWARLWVAGAEDDALRERIRPLTRRARRLIREIAAHAMPEVAAAPPFDTRLAVALSILSGLGFQLHFDPRGTERRGDPWPVHRAGIELILHAPAASPGSARTKALNDAFPPTSHP